METTDERAHKSIFARAKSGGNGCKVSEKRFFDGSGPRENDEKTPRWAVLSKFLRPKQGETEAKQCFARETTRLGPSCVGNSRQVGATGGGQRWFKRVGVLADHVTAVPENPIKKAGLTPAFFFNYSRLICLSTPSPRR